MDLKAMREKAAQVHASLLAFENIDEMTEEQEQEFEALHEEFTTLSNKIAKKEKLESVKNAAAVQPRKVAPVAAPVQAAATRVEVGVSATDKFGGFKNNGEFYQAIRNAASGRIDQRLTNAMMERDGEAGGFMVTPDVRTTIETFLQEEGSLFARARQFTTSSNMLTIPTDETQPWSVGGAKAYWVAEAARIPQTQFAIGGIDLKLHKLAALVPITDELLEDAPAVEQYMNQVVPNAIKQKLNEAMISGDGVGKPMGILNSSATLVVPKEAGQVADTFTPGNAIAMASRMLNRGNAVWLMNAALPEALTNFKDAQGNYIFLRGGQSVNQGPYDTLLGMPIMDMMSAMPAIGDKGDVILADFSMYGALTKAGVDAVKTAQSIHVYFDRDMQCFRYVLRIDGRPLMKAPITSQFGGYQKSPFVTLADR